MAAVVPPAVKTSATKKSETPAVAASEAPVTEVKPERPNLLEGLTGMPSFFKKKPDGIIEVPAKEISQEEKARRIAQAQSYAKSQTRQTHLNDANEKINGIASRYAGPMMNGLIGLYNTFQKPDKYTLPSYTPVMPYGRLALVNPAYNPMDENRAVNQVLANAAGTRRALLNSGAGTVTPQTLLAMNYGTGQNIGAARAQAQQYNNQLYNNVIQQRNANAQTLGTFDSSLALQRAGILNSRQLQDMNNFLKLQQLNYASESGKYAAISSSLTDLAKGLSDIGNETYSRNSANSVNSYSQDESGNNEYDQKKKKTDGTATKRNGGFLRRYKGR